LIKFARRPKKRPIGAQAATMSPKVSTAIFCSRANQTIAVATPIKPP